MHKCAKCGKSAGKVFECSDEGGCFNADEEHMLLASCTYCSADCFQKVCSPVFLPLPLSFALPLLVCIAKLCESNNQ